jgi:hypothetical protein
MKNRPNREVFKLLVKAFDQLNKEREGIINGQGEVLHDFSLRLHNYVTGGDDKKGLSEENQKAIAALIEKMNHGELFDKIKYDDAINQISEGKA